MKYCLKDLYCILFQFFNWAPDQPDNTQYGPSNRQDCLAIYEKNGQWDDGFCLSRHNFLCEIE